MNNPIAKFFTAAGMMFFLAAALVLLTGCSSGRRPADWERPRSPLADENPDCGLPPKNYAGFIKNIPRPGAQPSRTRILSISRPRKMRFKLSDLGPAVLESEAGRHNIKSAMEKFGLDMRSEICVHVIKYRYSYVHRSGQVREQADAVLLFRGSVLLVLEEADIAGLPDKAVPE